MNIREPSNGKEAYRMIISGLNFLKKDSPESNELINLLYTPDIQLTDYLGQLKTFLEIEKPTKNERQKAGYLLEKILVLSFKGLAGYSEIKNYQSASHQHDLLISGDGAEWDIICDRLYLQDPQSNLKYRGILVEAKAIDDSVSVSQFARLCSIMSLEFCNTVGLGIFFTVKGAAGFPIAGKRRMKCVRECRLCQALYYAQTGKGVIVLDKTDILELDKNGALIRILIRKIKEIEEMSGLHTVSVDEPIDVDLPDYLKGLI